MKKTLLISAGILFSLTLIAGQPTPTVAIVIDSQTLSLASDGLSSYVEAIRNDGKNAVIVEDVWQEPDSIRACLYRMYRDQNLEGAVFVGDIPIPMIRDAQHLTTAFKMDQSRDWKDSSVPSDRFYDDFDLKFDFLKEDDDKPLFFYYSLRADSPQFISSEIYSARIKAPDIPGKTKYEAINMCLKKMAAAKAESRKIDRILLFAGHGYNSESSVSRIDENRILRYHFPQMMDNVQGNRISFINYDQDSFVKSRLLAALSDASIDIAILHHHGEPDIQYLSPFPQSSTVRSYKENMMRIIRRKIAGSRNPEAERARYESEYEVPDAWFTDMDEPSTVEEDSLFYASMDIHIQDLHGIRAQPKFIMLDACFNGAFNNDDYIAGHYVFGDGETVAVRANSVNTLQDTWSNELIGLLNCGVCVGNWIKQVYTLETHIIGDPTYRFSSFSDLPYLAGCALDYAISSRSNDVKFWKRLLKKASVPDVRALCLVMLARNDAITEESLLSLLKDDPDPVVRTEAYFILKTYRSSRIVEATSIALSDSYEFLVRIAAATAAKTSDLSLLPALAEMYSDPTTSARVFFQVRSALGAFPAAETVAAIERAKRSNGAWPGDEAVETYKEYLMKSEAALISELESLDDMSLTFRKRRSIVAPQKNRCQILPLEAMFRYLENGEDADMKICIAEILGWYDCSVERDNIKSFLESRRDKEPKGALRDEISKSILRLSSRF